MIAIVNLALFPSNELLTFAKGTISLSTAKSAQLPVIDPFLNNVTQKCNDFQSALERESKNPLRSSFFSDCNLISGFFDSRSSAL